MSIPDDAEHLRQRAGALRRLAAAIEVSDAVDLGRLAGTDTWIGPTPEACRADLRAIRTDLLAGALELRRSARQLERQAADLAATGLGPA